MQTNDPHIYAAGDCVEVTNLITHNKQHWPMGDAANLQGRVVAQNVVFGNIEEYEGFVGTGICKVFEFTAGSTGLSEGLAGKEGYANLITAIHAAPDKPGFMGGKPVIIKMLADKTTGRFLGMQAVGTGDVSKRIATAAMALHGRLCISHLVNLDLPYAPPFSPAIDNFIAAVHVIENKWRHRMVGISSVDVKNKVDAGEDVFILDVRGPDEFEAMRLGIGETLIPLGKLRDDVNKLPRDKNKEIIVYCKISLRGYEAACFLNGIGYTNVKVMEGGVVAWPFKREK
jgi:rhodanese-related sulfurtransferase